MNKIKGLYLFFLLAIMAFYSCSKDSNEPAPKPDPKPVTLNNEVNDFVWRGLNEVYLWQQDVPDLADTKNDNKDDYYTFLNGFDTPENLFYKGLLYQYGTVDKFSYIVDDYTALENSFQGISKSSGLDFRLVRLGSSDDIFGYVRYVANDSDAATKDIKRGEFFLEVDGQQLTVNNYRNLLFGSNDTFTLGMANITNNTIDLNGKTVALTKTEFTESPILVNKVIDANSTKVGYLMYNGFIADFDSALNDVFADFKAQGVTELVLDFRYNPGGRVSSAISLAQMVTGQFTGEVFSTEIWNNKYQAYYEQNKPESLINRFKDKLFDNVTPINSLMLTRVFVLTTEGTASASELVINSLDPYIDVVHIGTKTTGKYTASITLYDSPNFGRKDVNVNHTYAMQPLVLKSANKNGVGDYYDGLTPDHVITYQTSSGGQAEGENILNMGVLGNENEPFLSKALELITGETTRFSTKKQPKVIDFTPVADTKDFTLLGKNMYIERDLF